MVASIPTLASDFVYLDDNVSASQKVLIQQAADRWSEVIVGDLSDQVSGGLFIDDLLVEVTTTTVDGSFGTLGFAGPREFRSSADGGLPIRAAMTLDIEDIDRMETGGSLVDLVIHELGHALGTGTLWDSFGLVTSGSDPTFTGANAVAQYQAIFNTAATSIPLDGDSHWDEAVFGTEVLTPTLSGGATNEISMVTVGSMEDLGYVVHYGAADDYTSPAGDPFVAPPNDPAPVSVQAAANTHLVTVVSGETVTEVNFGSYATDEDVFLVNSTLDTGDADLSDGVAKDASGNATLRAAIEQANFSTGSSSPDEIRFTTAQTISLSSALPAITDPIVIDGTQVDGYTGTPMVQIDNAGVINEGLLITAGSSTISGLSFTGFADAGLELNGGGGNTINDNYFGLSTSGSADPNYHGLRIQNSANNSVSGNVVSGNNRSGVFLNGTASTGNVFTNNYVGTDPTGNTAIPNATDGFTVFSPNNQIGQASQGNIISGNSRYGVFTRFSGRGGNSVQGNVIGLNASGTAPIPNTIGVNIQNESNQIGGTSTAQGNVVSGNSAFGIAITFSSATGNVVQGNKVGVNAAGDTDLGNGLFGVRITVGANNTIGGTTAGAGNLISGNNHSGVLLALAGTTGNDIVGNQIGTDAAGDTVIANSNDGVRIVQSASGNNIDQNQISGNGSRGVTVDGAATSANTISNNTIGTDSAGTSAIHNGPGGAIRILAPSTSVTGNLISSVDAGIVAFTTNANGTQITGNTIGTDLTETITTLGMTTGVQLSSGISDVLVSQNIIANNVNGVLLNTAGQRNRITENSIYDNSSIGIDLGGDGTTANDTADADSGVNLLLNTPVLNSATISGSTITINYSVTTDSENAVYPLLIEFFVADNSGQGKTYLGSDSIAAVGSDSVDLATVSGLTAGDNIVATATDADGNTSEFSLSIEIG